MENGYVKIYRIILKNPIIKKPIYAWLWTVLLLKANHQETKMIWNGEIIIIKEGQFITGRKQLSEETSIPESTIEDILKYLERQHQIQQQKTTKFRLITIVNWKKYQKPDNKPTTENDSKTKESQKTRHQIQQQKTTKNGLNNDIIDGHTNNSDSISNNKATTKQQQADTNKNDKNDKNDKNKEEDVASATFLSFYESYPKKELKKKSKEIWQRKKLDNQLPVILDFISRAKNTDRWQKGYIKQPPAFLNGECWNDDLSAYNDKKQNQAGCLDLRKIKN